MSAAKPTVKKTSSKSASGPSYEAMIKEAILAHPEERAGLGRVTIKKYLHQKHPETGKIPEASFNSHVNRAITKGHEKKIFVLPKGISGKIKLAPEAKKAATKKAATKKPAVKKPAAKKPAAKKPAAKPAAAKKTTTAKKPAAKKAAPAKKTTSSTAAKAKKPAAKKTATKKLTSRPPLAPIAQAAPKKKAAPKKA